jgi:hypothetical protein
MASLAALVTFACVIGIYVQQQGKARQQAEELARPSSPAGLVLATQAKGTSLTAVGRVAGLPEPCTAWLLDTKARASTKAVAVTTGRCVGITDSAHVVTDRKVAKATIDFDAFAPVTTAAPPTPVRVPVEQVLYASSRWKDLALLQLGSTYGELQAAGISLISPVDIPAAGTAVLLAGVPVLGIPSDQRYVRATRCTVGATVDLVEGPWLFSDARATDCTGVLGGSTGSPVFNPAGQAVGMVTSTTIGAVNPVACGVGTPCEVGAGTVTSAADTTYVLPLAGLAACWQNGELTLSGPCPLEDPEGVAAAIPQATAAAPGSTVDVSLDDAGPAYIADKQGTLGSLDCAAPQGWSHAVPAQDWNLELTVPRTGWVLACVGAAEQPTPVLVRADAAARS